MIQAIVCALVPTSGAGMSESGPTIPSSSVAKRRVSASSSRRLEPGRIAGHAALRATERHLHEGALPGHPHGQGAHVIEISLRVVSQAALRRPTRIVVLDAVAGEHLDRATVEADREVHRQLALARGQDAAHAGLDGEVVGGAMELGQGGRKCPGTLSGRGGRSDGRHSSGRHDRWGSTSVVVDTGSIAVRREEAAGRP